MAEGGVEDMAKAYQSATDKMCDLCLEEDSFKQATWFCRQCRQRLCDKCRKYHRKVASLKDHEMVRTEDMPPATPQSTEESSDELRMPMCTTHNLPIQLYCEDHNQPVCDSCKIVDHRKCKRLRDLENVATENTGRSNEVLQHLKSIDNGLGKTEQAIHKESKAMEERKDQIIQKIKNKMQKIQALGLKKISEVEKMFEKEHRSLRKENDVIKQTQLLVSKSIGDIETATQTGSEEEVFIATSRAEKEAGKYQDILNDTRHVTPREVDFEVDNRLTDIDFGEIKLTKCKLDKDVMAQAVEYLNTKSSSSSSIAWFDVLSGERVIVLHNGISPQPSRMTLYSRNTGILSQLDLPGFVISGETLNDHLVIMAIWDKPFLQTVNIVNDKLILKDTHQTDGFQFLILKYSEQYVLVLTTIEDNHFCFQIRDLNGIVQTDIPINENLEIPQYMRMSNDRNIIYLCDITNGCYGFNFKGDTLFHYSQPNVEQYSGLAVDHHECVHLYIWVNGSGHLTKLSPRGQCLQRSTVNGYPLRYYRNKLYLSSANAKNEGVIKFIYV